MANLFYTNASLVVNGIKINYIDKLDFLRLFYQARLTTFTSKNIKSISQTAGIVPFDLQNVLSRLKVSIPSSLYNHEILTTTLYYCKDLIQYN
jgi:hypothetical protein